MEISLDQKIALLRIEAKTVKLSCSCWVWIGAASGHKKGSGYQYPAFSYKGKAQRVTRWMYELHTGISPKDMFVCHSCDTPLCVNPEHLFLGTPQDNVDDMVSKGRHLVERNLPTGENHFATNFTDESAMQLKHDYVAGAKTEDLAASYNVCRSTVMNILRGVTFKHLPILERADPNMNRHRNVKNSSLSDEQVLEMREMYAKGGETFVSLGVKFGVHKTTAANVVKRKYYKNI